MLSLGNLDPVSCSVHYALSENSRFFVQPSVLNAGSLLNIRSADSPHLY